jgi:tetratricopeptide (TPR) repeat protein
MNRRFRSKPMLARSVRSRVTPALALASACLLFAPGARGQGEGVPVVNSSLTAPLFYQLLIGEIELREGAAGTAYEVVLDAARKTGEEQLFRRATDIALQARAGDQALTAVQAWRAALPGSLEAHRYQVQLLVALNRIAETAEPLRSLIGLTPPGEQAGLITASPRLYARASDRRAAAAALDAALASYAAAPATATAARVAMGRGWLLAQDRVRALDLAQAAHRADPLAEGPALLGIELMQGTPAAEVIVSGFLAARPDSNAVRMLYARVLVATQRHADAITQFEIVANNDPSAAAPWLSLGALHLELHQAARATAALQKYLQLAQASTRSTVSADAGQAEEDDDEPATADAGLMQAYLLLAQAAERQGDFAQAERWLAKIDSPQRALEVQARRASLLARQGKLDEARALIRAAPERTTEDARAKLLAEAQLLRDVRQWADAYAVLAAANVKFPNDADLLYEQSMLAEKLDRLAEMEQLLRRVMEIQPDYHHAYNALGYSLAERNMRLEEARALIRKALELRPGEPFITDSLGWVEYRLGNREEAMRLLRQAYHSRPDTEIAAHLGEVLWVSGQRDEARRILRDARSRDSGNEVLRETLARLRVDL